jgi:hypothetical protein
MMTSETKRIFGVPNRVTGCSIEILPKECLPYSGGLHNGGASRRLRQPATVLVLEIRANKRGPAAAQAVFSNNSLPISIRRISLVPAPIS